MDAVFEKVEDFSTGKGLAKEKFMNQCRATGHDQWPWAAREIGGAQTVESGPAGGDQCASQYIASTAVHSGATINVQDQQQSRWADSSRSIMYHSLEQGAGTALRRRASVVLDSDVIVTAING